MILQVRCDDSWCLYTVFVVLALPCCSQKENEIYYEGCFYVGTYQWQISEIMKLLWFVIFDFFISWFKSGMLPRFPERWRSLTLKNDSDQPLIFRCSIGMIKQNLFAKKTQDKILLEFV